MSLIDDIRKDREAGTPGPWEVRYERGCTCLYMLEHPFEHRQMCDETYYPSVPDNDTDWGRIARVPQMEAALLAAEELADAALAYQRSDFDTVMSSSDKLTACRAAYRAAIGAA